MFRITSEAFSMLGRGRNSNLPWKLRPPMEMFSRIGTRPTPMETNYKAGTI